MRWTCLRCRDGWAITVETSAIRCTSLQRPCPVAAHIRDMFRKRQCATVIIGYLSICLSSYEEYPRPNMLSDSHIKCSSSQKSTIASLCAFLLCYQYMYSLDINEKWNVGQDVCSVVQWNRFSEALRPMTFRKCLLVRLIIRNFNKPSYSAALLVVWAISRKLKIANYSFVRLFEKWVIRSKHYSTFQKLCLFCSLVWTKVKGLICNNSLVNSLKKGHICFS